MKKLLILSACLLALWASPMPALAGEPSVVVVRIVDGGGQVFVTLAGPHGRKEEFTFKKESDKADGALFGAMHAATQGYQRVLEKLYREGYELKSTVPSSATATNPFTTLVFVKPG
ncbi:hypothetical protein ACFST9_06280 [Hymenobacter monticola]|uniref:Uncharacterized protein n=1 Tax=Hymenobacter monticola TaxID=1705399 RepID=A0ABY4BAZ1_9BACT|nr:hypothetical protein [Hymenobacter monticola]UOE36225.1 hypothetical protein MTP16_11410 [Hymenobacter monticola]